MQAKVIENRDGTLTITLPIQEPVNLSSTGKTYAAGNGGRLECNTRFGVVRISVNAYQFPAERDAYLAKRKGSVKRPNVPRATAKSGDLESDLE